VVSWLATAFTEEQLATLRGPPLTHAVRPAHEHAHQLIRPGDTLVLQSTAGFVFINIAQRTIQWSWGTHTVGVLGGGPSGVNRIVAPPTAVSVISHCGQNSSTMSEIDLSACQDLAEIGLSFARMSSVASLRFPNAPPLKKLEGNFCTDAVLLMNVDLFPLENLQFIRDDAFKGCTALQCLRLPPAVLEIGKFFCAHCVSLKTLNLGQLHGLRRLGRGAFAECAGLSLTLSHSATISREHIARGVFVIQYAAPAAENDDDSSPRRPELRQDSEVWEDW